MKGPAKRWVVLTAILALAAVGVFGAAALLQKAPTTPGGGGNNGGGDGGGGGNNTGLKAFIVNITEQGFNGQASLTLTVKLGDTVRVTFVHQDPYGDFHPILLSGYGLSVTVTAGADPAVMEFKADQAGTFGFYCINHDCNIHNTLQNGKLVVEG